VTSGFSSPLTDAAAAIAAADAAAGDEPTARAAAAAAAAAAAGVRRRGDATYESSRDCANRKTQRIEDTRPPASPSVVGPVRTSALAERT